MCKAYEVKESFVPHRVDGKVAKAEKKSRKSNNQEFVRDKQQVCVGYLLQVEGG